MKRIVSQFLREADKGAGAGGGGNVPDKEVSITDLMAGDETPPSTGADDTPPAEPAKQRRAKAEKKEEAAQGAEDEETPAPDEAVEPEKKPEEPEEPSNEDYKKLHEAKAESNKRLRADNDKLRKEFAGVSQKAQLLDNINGMLTDPDAANAAQGLRLILEEAAKRFDGDIVKALANAGFKAEPIKAANPLDDVRDTVRTKVTDPERIEAWGWKPEEVEMVARMNGDIVDSLLEALGPAVAQQARPQQEQRPPGGDTLQGSFDNEYRVAVESIQEEVPLFEISRAEAEEARRRFPTLGLEDAVRLVFEKRLDEEKVKQRGLAEVKPMVSSNGRVKGNSVLDADRVAAGPISLSEAFESFKDFKDK